MSGQEEHEDGQGVQNDGATVAIFHSPRQAILHLTAGDIDAALAAAAKQEQVEGPELASKKFRWTALTELVGAEERVAAVAADIVEHYLDGTEKLAGKAMLVSMTRKNCVRLYNAIRMLPECAKVNVVMTGNLPADPTEWSEQGPITSTRVA